MQSFHEKARTTPRFSSAAHRLTGPEHQFIAADDEFRRGRADFGKSRFGNRAAQMLFDRIAKRTSAETRMKAALNNERDDRITSGEIESFAAEESQLSR